MGCRSSRAGKKLLAVAGEVHLETIIKDLRQRFARIELRVSPPLVAFRESVLLESEAPEPVQKPIKVLPPCLLQPLLASALCY
jgi:ribosome assembly protein 1